MFSSGDEDESEATQILAYKSSVQFKSEFLGRKTATIRDIEHERKLRDLSLRVAEAEARIQEYKNLANAARSEATESKTNEKEALAKYKKAQHEVENLKIDVDRLSEIERDFIARKHSTEFLLHNYKSSLTKYKTWYEHGTKQLDVVKEILLDLGRWTPENRYKIYFSYSSALPVSVADDDVAGLAQGSILDYKGIDDIDNLDTSTVSSKFLSNSTQTDSGNFHGLIDDSSIFSMDSTGDGSGRGNNNVSANAIQMTESELQFLDLRESLRKFEHENDSLKHQLAILKRNKDAVALEEENKRLLSQIQELMEQNKPTPETAENAPSFGGPEDATASVVDPSVVFYHLRDNPLSMAVKEYEEREAKRMRLDPEANNVDYQQYVQAVELVQKLQNELKTTVDQKDRTTNYMAEAARKYREIVKSITGFDIKMRNEEFIDVSSVYDHSNQFGFQRSGKDLNVLDSNYAKSWHHLMEQYLPASLPGFTAAVTLELYSKQEATATTQAS